jgi:hypothetical protein
MGGEMEVTVKNKIILFYLLLVTFHVAHILEETWGRIWMIDKIYGLGLFLFINWVLFCIPLFFFYLFILDKKIGYFLSMAYSLFMVLNGIGHNIATIVTGKYFGGYAGGFSGLGLVIVGIPLSFLLFKNSPKRNRQPKVRIG